MPKPGFDVDPAATQRITDTFMNKCGHCFFMGRFFKFDVDINQCHDAPTEKCVRAKEEAYVNWIVTQIMSDTFKEDMQTIVVMPQGLNRMSTRRAQEIAASATIAPLR